MTDVNSKSTATPSTLAEVDALITSQLEPAPIEETLAEKIVRLEAQLAEARTGNLKKPIKQADGTTRTFDDIRAENRKLMDEWALEVESSRRLREEIAAKNPVPYADHTGQLAYRPYGFTEKPLLDEDGAIRLFGLAKWAALTPRQKAQAQTATQRDVDAVKLDEIFGRASSARKAMALSSENPSLYRLCKIKAKKEGIF